MNLFMNLSICIKIGEVDLLMKGVGEGLGQEFPSWSLYSIVLCMCEINFPFVAGFDEVARS